jgi:hypothetical protein
VALWISCRQRDSIELLKVMEAVPKVDVHVVRNGYFDDERTIDLCNGPNTREAIGRRRGRSVTFPDLADRGTDNIQTKKLALSAAVKTEQVWFHGDMRELVEEVLA